MNFNSQNEEFPFVFKICSDLKKFQKFQSETKNVVRSGIGRIVEMRKQKFRWKLPLIFFRKGNRYFFLLFRKHQQKTTMNVEKNNTKWRLGRI